LALGRLIWGNILKHTTETMQQYIANYKLKIIENRLLYGNMRISEIADELGFTDKSHLIRTFRKYRGVSSTEYKKSLVFIA
jgi:AraC-like DNA-binding protein